MPAQLSKPFTQATIADVARRAGVSIATVSRVLNGTARVSAETAGRVNDAMRALGYKPQAAARNLATRRTYTLGLLLPELSQAFFFPMLCGVDAAARQSGYDLLIGIPRHGELVETGSLSHRHNLLRQPLGEQNTDGLLVFTDSLPLDEMERLARIHFPMVILYQEPPAQLDIPCVTIENKSAARAITDHLIEQHGCRRIAFLRGLEGNQDSEWRERGYRDSLLAHGLSPDPAYIARGNYNQTDTRAALEALLDAGAKPDAIFAGDDESAAAAIGVLAARGLRVPEDIAVTGFNDVSYTRFLSPPLTTVRAPTEQVGCEAVRQLIRLINHETVERLILLPTQLVIRESCGCHTAGGSYEPMG